MTEGRAVTGRQARPGGDGAQIQSEPRPTAAGGTPLVEIDHVSKSFPGVRALRDVSVEVHGGEVHALVGENGAGKSTLMGLISGSLGFESGSIAICGKPVRGLSPRHVRQLGVGTVFQDDSLIPDLSVAQNIRLDLAGAGKEDLGAERYADLLRRFGLDLDLDTPVRDLHPRERQVIEIVKVLAAEPRLVICDEPTASLGVEESEALFEVLRDRAQAGVGVIYITHRLAEVKRLADIVTVLRDGSVVAHRLAAAGVDEDDLINLMVGRRLDALFPPKAGPRVEGAESEPLLGVERLSGEGLQDVSIIAREGEIVGLGGIVGQGQREVLRALSGLDGSRGSVRVAGGTVRRGSIAAARHRGISYLSADRKTESLLPDLGVLDNMLLTSLGRTSRLGFVSRKRQRALAGEQIRELDIKVADLERPVSMLSGGNQQKVAIGRSLLEGPRVYLVEEPTQGVDVGARQEIYRALRAAADAGAAVVVSSSDSLELVGLCDRIYVLSDGRVANELVEGEMSERAVVSAAVQTDAALLAEAEPEAAAEPAGRGGRLGAFLASDTMPILLLGLIVVAMTAVAGLSISGYMGSSTIGNLMFLSVPIGFAALAQALSIIVGGIDLSVGPVMSLSTVALASLAVQNGSSLSFAGALAAAVGVGAGIGLLNAVLIRRIGVSPLIATLGTYIFVQGVALLWMPVPGGYVPASFSDFMSARIGFVPWAFLLLIAVGLLGELWYRRATGGLSLRALGSRPPAAHRIGIAREAGYYLAYGGGGMMAGVAGLFLAATIGVGDPVIGIPYTLTSVAAVVLGGLSTAGGRGSVVGPILGAIVLAQIDNITGFLHLAPNVGAFAQGGLILIPIAAYSWIRARGSLRYEPFAG
jgi:ribose transport system ATP-binding protein